MSGRAVGGAAGAGCGALGLVGLLIGVGLTVWLGMRAMDSVGSGTRGTRTTTAAGEGDGPGGLGTLTVPGTGAPTGTVTLDPAIGLGDGMTVKVAAADLEAGAWEVTECLTNQTRAAGVDGACDPSTTVRASVPASGDLAAGFTVQRVIRVLDAPYDCAAFAGACVLVVHPRDSLEGAPQAPLTFDPEGPPVTASIPPPG